MLYTLYCCVYFYTLFVIFNPTHAALSQYVYSDAVDIKVVDDWGNESFEVVEGDNVLSFDKVAPGKTASAKFSVLPKTVGEMMGFRASVSYKAETGGPALTGYSTSMSPHRIVPGDLYAQVTVSRQVHTLSLVLYSLFELLIYVCVYFFYHIHVAWS